MNNLSNQKNFFNQSLQDSDPDIYAIHQRELKRQSEGLEMIASENLVSRAVMDAIGSIFTNKYAEGYPHRRYYGGCEYADQMEDLAIARVCKLFGAKYANVQPHSGSQANQAVFMALMKPGDTFLGLSLSSGGHLTHGAAANISGKWFKPVNYGVRQDGVIDYDQVADMAMEHKPKVIITGGSAYARVIDFKKFRDIADKVGAFFFVDMAHFAGLVAAGEHPNPLPLADVVTSTTHKTLRCSRGGLVLTNNEDIAKKINSAIFPGLQGGPLLASMVGKAVGFGEALKPEFKTYIKQVVENAHVLADELMKGGLQIVSGGTDTHLMLVDLRPKKITGDVAEKSLDRAGITCNKNGIPNDPEKPTVTSGIRLGTPALTSRGFGVGEIKMVAQYILEVLDGLQGGKTENPSVEAAVKAKVLKLCNAFPIYSHA
ncbi:MAG: serine hydroxymethyltransferase [Hydrotalea sp.]|nr:serine hydroxymethyltransferase [Hydrotalea sp.]